MPKKPAASAANVSLLSDTTCLMKTVACIVILLAAAAWYVVVCREVAVNYGIVLPPSVAVTVPWLNRLCASALVYFVAICAVVILVRPVWLVIASYAAASILFPLIIGFSPGTLIMAGVSVLLFLLFISRVLVQLKNQVHFSTHPLSDRKLLLVCLATALVCVAFGIGYARDADRNGYVIPPTFKTYTVDIGLNLVRSNAQFQKLKPDQQPKALAESKQGLVDYLDKLDQQWKPYQKYFPAIMGLLLSSVVETFFIILALFTMAILRLLFWILKKTNFTHESVEMIEVKHLTLMTVEGGPPSKVASSPKA